MSFSVRAAEYVSGSGLKARVCASFYELGQCPFDDHCEHAHHFAELDRTTQNRLLEAVSLDAMPRAFLAPSRTPKAPRRANHSLTSNSLANASSVSSVSSVCSLGGSPQRPPFRIRLPARCRFPHVATAGTYYDVLGVPRDAPAARVMERYRDWQREGYKRMRLVDPQRADALDAVIVEARNVIGHPQLRAEYDKTLPGAAHRESDALSSVNSSQSHSERDGWGRGAETKPLPARAIRIDGESIW